MPDKVNHPSHYGGDQPYEVIKVLEAWELGGRTMTAGFNLGNTIKYIARSGLKGDFLEDLKKASWYLNREIENEVRRRDFLDQQI